MFDAELMPSRWDPLQPETSICVHHRSQIRRIQPDERAGERPETHTVEDRPDRCCRGGGWLLRTGGRGADRTEETEAGDGQPEGG